MNSSTTLYKIRPVPAQKHCIAVQGSAGSNASSPHLLFCGGFHSSMSGTKASFLAALCERMGYGYTRFDYRGHGVSDGVFEHCDLHDWLQDTLAVIDDLDRNLVLIGSSMGAWLATLATIERPDRIDKLVTIAAAADFTEELLWPALSTTAQAELLANETVDLISQYDQSSWPLRMPLFQSGRELSILNKEECLGVHCPVRMLHGTNDTDVPWQYSQRLLDKLPPATDATLTLVHKADHRLSDNKSLGLIQQAIF